MSESILTPGFRSSEIFANLKSSLDSLSPEAKASFMKQTPVNFEFFITNNEGKTETFNTDFIRGVIIKGKSPFRTQTTFSMKDTDFVEMATGKISGHQAFIKRKYKISGNDNFIVKLDFIFKQLDKDGSYRAKL